MKNLRRCVGLLTVLLSLSCIDAVYAEYPELTFRHEHHLFTLDPDEYPHWHTALEVWLFEGKKIKAPPSLRVDGDTIPDLPEGVVRTIEYTWNLDAIAETIEHHIGLAIKRPRGEVTIDRNEENEITFEGVGFLGRELDEARAAILTVEAIENGVTDIILPVDEQQPIMHLLDPELLDIGITEVVAIGESDFSLSPGPRRHNIANGLSKFNGHIIPKDAVFSFNDVLGPVHAGTGYEKELVIVGPKTIPEYGGGLCQVSTTAYRGIWEYGFPIEERRNHSFAVLYYSPQGTDATIYPPVTDMKFTNNSPGALLIQTHSVGNKAYFIYYGTRDNRATDIIGPYVWDERDPPPDKVEYIDELPAGEERQVGKAVPGMQSAWFRVLHSDTERDIVEPFYSFYEARPNYTQIGQSPVVPEPEEVKKTSHTRRNPSHRKWSIRDFRKQFGTQR